MRKNINKKNEKLNASGKKKERENKIKYNCKGKKRRNLENRQIDTMFFLILFFHIFNIENLEKLNKTREILIKF